MTIKAVVDTNIWVSSLINPVGFPARLRNLFATGAFQCVVSTPMLEELADVLGRPKIRDKYGISALDIEELLILLEERSEDVLLSGNVSVCRDVDDNGVIETAINGKAQYIITRDDDIKFDLNVISFLSRHNIAVVSLSTFLNILYI